MLKFTFVGLERSDEGSCLYTLHSTPYTKKILLTRLCRNIETLKLETQLRCYMLMKNFNSFFNQLTAMPKRLAMVLTVLFTVGVGSMLGAEEVLFSQTYPGSPTKYTNAYNSSFSITTNGYALMLCKY